ncbi:MAG: hypothetical protein EA379_02320 [Phycisphaerales bacterium]|nr:MAG: hypothetical protein EA379_02320 [Phycisphaerales bacterium]
MLRLLAPILLLAGAVALAIIGDRPQPPASYTFLSSADAFTLDPQRMSYDQDMRIAHAIYDGLVRWDPYTFDIIPGVAERWDVSPDGLVYTFHLRDNARWSNGDPVTAQDFRYSWRRALMPDTAANYTSLFFVIDGAREFFDWRSQQLAEHAARPAAERTRAAAQRLRLDAEERFRETVAIDTPDARTLTVTLSRPAAYFLDLCAFPIFFAVHRESVEAWADVDPVTGRIDQRHGWTKPPHLISSGAYKVVSWRFKRDMRLERNEHYWDSASVRSDSVRMVVIEDPSTRVLAFETGAADWNTDVAVDYLGDMLDARARGERHDVHPISRFGTYFWHFNCMPTLTGGRPNPFHDARVRRAFTMSMNKHDIVGKVRRGGEDIATTFVPPGSIPGFDPEGSIVGLPYDPPAARALLEDAGWTRNESGALTDRAGTPFPVVELLASTGAYHDRVALAMGAMWETELGVRTRVVRKETKTYRDDLLRRDYMLARGGWLGDYGDPTTFLNLHRTGDGNNHRGFSNPNFDDLLDRADRETDPQKRMRYLEEAERMTMEVELPILPIWHYATSYQFHPDQLKGLSTHPRLTQYLHYIYKVDPAKADPNPSSPPTKPSGTGVPPVSSKTSDFSAPVSKGQSPQTPPESDASSAMQSSEPTPSAEGAHP